MERLDGVLRPYPWGSRTLLAQLRGTPSPSEKPEAELWFGAHPAAPATIDGRGLDEIIAEDPQAALGDRVIAHYGEQLPFLVKLLAADSPLSIQAHPSREQAVAGFERENAEGISLNSPQRNYKDSNPKPELIVALTTFRAMAGFRPVEQMTELFEAFSSPAWDRYAALLPAAGGAGDMRVLFTTLVSLPKPALTEVFDAVGHSARTIADGGTAAHPAWVVEAAEVFLELAQRYPGDAGAFAALLLNIVTLKPGEAAFLGAGQLHAYLSGLGVEVMENSDNVLRGGLTTKHVDVPELVRVLDFSSLESPRADTEEVAGGKRFVLPVESFTVSMHELDQGELRIDEDGPAIALCTAGTATDGTMSIAAGEAVWIPASDGAVTLRPATDGEPTQVFVATV